MKSLLISLWLIAYSYITLWVGTIKNSPVLKYTSLILLYLLMGKIIFIDISSGSTISDQLSLSVIWTILAVCGISLGFRFDSKNYRLGSLVLLGIMIFKVFLFDTWNLSEIYRIVAYLALGGILIGAGFIYVKYQEKIKQALL